MVVAPRAGEIHHSSTVIIGWCHCCFLIRSCNGGPGDGSLILGWWCCWVLMDWVAPQFLHHAVICSIQIGGFFVEVVPQSHYWWSCCVVHMYLQQILPKHFCESQLHSMYGHGHCNCLGVSIISRSGLAEKSFAICLSLPNPKIQTWNSLVSRLDTTWSAAQNIYLNHMTRTTNNN